LSAAHDNETKAAVLAALLAGQAVSHIAEEYKIPRTTVQRWKSDFQSGKLTEDRTQKKNIGDLLTDYLTENLITLRAQAEHFRDKKWLAKQGAESSAVLHGVMTDKAIRLLEALSKSDVTPDKPAKD
jgi:transposase-like protein